jgi:Mg-chelatase subunit ChlD
MQIEGVRMWAFWRRIQYGSLYFTVLALCTVGVYYGYFYQAPTCFDSKLNGEELAVDCGGACTRICPFTVAPPTVTWSKSFAANQGEYNAVAYIENSNQFAGTPALSYTFTLKDSTGVITTRSGTTVLPPNSTYPVFEGRISTSGRVPTETTLTLEPASLWLPYGVDGSRFKTSDLSLTGADDRPRLTARIDNTTLESATDIEVIATIFDARGTPLTSSETFVDSLAGRGSQEITFTWPQPIAKTLRSCAVPTDVVLAIDLSGSMNNDSPTPPQPITDVLAAAEKFVAALTPGDQVGLVTFASSAILDTTLSSSTASLATKLPTLRIDPKEERGTTNTGDALKVAAAELASTRHNDNARRVLVLLTDGLATSPGEDPSAYAIAQSALIGDEVTLFAIGLGAGADQAFLEKITKKEQVYMAPTTATLEGIYQSITAAICEDGAARIDVIPKTGDNFAPLQ